MGLVDFAEPIMNAERALKAVHHAMLVKDYDKAMDFALQAIVETKIAHTAIRHEKEKQVPPPSHHP